MYGWVGGTNNRANGRAINMKNIGKVSRRWLFEVGVVTLEDLRAVGAVAAYRMIKAQQPQATLNLLWSLEGAIRNVDWRELPPEIKRKLRKLVE